MLAEQIAEGQKGIAGIMLESHLVAGRQDHESDKSSTYGKSITDACIDLTATKAIFEMLAFAVQKRRTSGGITA